MFLVCLLPEAAKMIAEHQHPGLFEETRKIKTLQMTKGAIANTCVSAVMLKASNWLYVVMLVRRSNNQFGTFCHFHRN